MSKEKLTIERIYPLSKEAVSFSIKKGEKTYFLDAPFNPNYSFPPKRSNSIFYTHFHKDHCPQEDAKIIEVDTFFNHETLVLLRHIGVNTNKFRRIRNLKLLQWNIIDGLGQLYPVPVSHSSVDASAFFLILDSGVSIFYSGDIRSGYRTEKAIEEIKNFVGKDGVSLFIGDATGIGKEHITEEEHIKRLKQSLFLANKNNVATAIFVKAGDYGNIALWFEKGVFEYCRVFLHPNLQRVLGRQGLNWLPFLYQHYGYIPPDINELEDSLRKPKGVVFLYDDCWQNLIRNNTYVLVNASRREIPYKSDNVIAVFPIGFSGHSSEAFNRFLQACNPKLVAFSHPPGKGSPKLGNAKLVLNKINDSIILP